MENVNNIETFFDSPERQENEIILKEILHLKENALMNQILEGFPDLAVLLNEQRQIVAFNSQALSSFETDNYFDIVGKRVGEALNCVHSNELIGGCGTSKSCSLCGAAKTIKNTNENNVKSIDECRVTVNRNGAELSLDLLVTTQPIVLENKQFTLFSIKDISHEKRREALEKIFFHDVLNTAGALQGLITILPEVDDDKERKNIEHAILSSSNQLVEEIIAQRELRNAEDGSLEPNLEELSANDILAKVKEMYQIHSVNKYNNLFVDNYGQDRNFKSDSSLLVRSIGNLVKNALEISKPQQKVFLFYEPKSDVIQFTVKSEPIINENTKLQLFQRSFSTKSSKGRGIGLYSVKLLVEQYLNGKVSFVSDEINKTAFTISLPYD